MKKYLVFYKTETKKLEMTKYIAVFNSIEEAKKAIDFHKDRWVIPLELHYHIQEITLLSYEDFESKFYEVNDDYMFN